MYSVRNLFCQDVHNFFQLYSKIMYVITFMSKIIDKFNNIISFDEHLSKYKNHNKQLKINRYDHECFKSH